MRYSVPISDLAYEQYDKFLDYIYHTLLNPQAADSLIFHKIYFKRHRYLFVYRVKQDSVIVEGMYHELQDYEDAIG